MEISIKKLLLRRFILFVGFVLPILGLLNCRIIDGSNQVDYCQFGGFIAEGYAELILTFLLISAFSLLMPVWIYILVILELRKKLPNLFFRKNNLEKKSNF